MFCQLHFVHHHHRRSGETVEKNVESSVQVGWGFAGKLGSAWIAAIAWLGASPEKLLELKTCLFSSVLSGSPKHDFSHRWSRMAGQMWVNRDRSYHYGTMDAPSHVSTCPDNDLHWEYSNLQRLQISTYGYNMLQHATTSMSSLASFFPMISPFVILKMGETCFHHGMIPAPRSATIGVIRSESRTFSGRRSLAAEISEIWAMKGTSMVCPSRWCLKIGTHIPSPSQLDDVVNVGPISAMSSPVKNKPFPSSMFRHIWISCGSHEYIPGIPSSNSNSNRMAMAAMDLWLDLWYAPRRMMNHWIWAARAAPADKIRACGWCFYYEEKPARTRCKWPWYPPRTAEKDHALVTKWSDFGDLLFFLPIVLGFKKLYLLGGHASGTSVTVSNFTIAEIFWDPLNTEGHVHIIWEPSLQVAFHGNDPGRPAGHVPWHTGITWQRGNMALIPKNTPPDDIQHESFHMLFTLPLRPSLVTLWAQEGTCPDWVGRWFVHQCRVSLGQNGWTNYIYVLN